MRLARFLGEGERARDSPTETVGRFIESRTAYLVEYGEVYHEIAHMDDGAPVLVSLSVGGTYDFGIGALQIVPRDAFAYTTRTAIASIGGGQCSDATRFGI
jgi:hypothetical protein